MQNPYHQYKVVLLNVFLLSVLVYVPNISNRNCACSMCKFSCRGCVGFSYWQKSLHQNQNTVQTQSLINLILTTSQDQKIKHSCALTRKNNQEKPQSNDHNASRVIKFCSSEMTFSPLCPFQHFCPSTLILLSHVMILSHYVLPNES